MRRGWALTVLMATALLVYLVMPNQLMAPAESPMPTVAAASPQPEMLLVDLAHDDSGNPTCASDDVTMLSRSTLQEHPAADEHIVPWAPRAAVLGRAGVAPPNAGTGNGARDALRPSLSALQVLRC
ncbi:hypothetical protein [Streptomyces scopuliridis]|uniref:hypothetical protein n=1 Tax=Streptomyces scopuliridis TaxID=452529 RepID=UPI0036A0DBB8